MTDNQSLQQHIKIDSAISANILCGLASDLDIII